MKKLIVIAAILGTSPVFAAGVTCPITPPAKKKPSAAYLAKMQRLKELEEEVAQLRKRNEELEAHKVEIREVIKHHPPILVEGPKPRRNALSLLGVSSRTGLDREDRPNQVIVRNDAQADLGAMYQRDFNRVRGSAAVTARGTWFLGVGLTF